MVSLRRTVLLTGASGVVGSALIPELRAHRVVALSIVGDHQVQWRKCTVISQSPGLSRQTYNTLTAQIDTVVHCGAVTDFATGARETSEVNVRGTENVVHFAAEADALLIYVSSAFVARIDTTRGQLGETSADPVHYLTSKQAAEQKVRESNVKAIIVRPSVVIGDSWSGQIARFQGLLALAAAVLRNAMPLLPLNPDSRIDVIPQDVVAKAITALMHRGEYGGEYWLTAGPAAPVAGKLLDIVVKIGQHRGIDVTRPRPVAPDMIDRLVRPVFISSLPPTARRRFDDMLAMTALFSAAQPFESSLNQIPGLRCPCESDLERAFAASVRYLAAAKRIETNLLEVGA